MTNEILCPDCGQRYTKSYRCDTCQLKVDTQRERAIKLTSSIHKTADIIRCMKLIVSRGLVTDIMLDSRLTEIQRELEYMIDITQIMLLKK